MNTFTFPIDNNEALQLIVRTTVAVTLKIVANVRLPDGSYALPLIANYTPPVTDGSANTVLFTNIAKPGEVVSVTVYPTTTGIQSGQCFVIGSIIIHDPNIEDITKYVLFADHATSLSKIGFPFSGIRATTEGKGYTTFSTFVATSTVQYTFSIPANTVAKIFSAKIVLTTGGVDTPKTVVPVVNSSAGTESFVANEIIQGPGLAWTYYFIRQVGAFQNAEDQSLISLPLGDIRLLTSSDSFALIALGGTDTIDVLSAGLVSFEQWIAP